ncbi:MAG: hypothetical protein Kow00105_01300 [Phycisphaeraceae bacterium]
MFVYAGIDEAGYGPLLGPLVVGRAVLTVPNLPHDAPPPDLWRRLSKAVCKKPSDKLHRIPINDSKKLKSQSAGLKYLERGCLAFASLNPDTPTITDVAGWLDLLGETAHRHPDLPVWYRPGEGMPWQTLPGCITQDEQAIDTAMLRQCAERIGVESGGLGAAVVFEPVFNRMVDTTRSKAAASFTFVAQHLQHVWEHFGRHSPYIVVDRQGGRTHYRDQLALSFPSARVDVIEETTETSIYRMTQQVPVPRAMQVTFTTEAEQTHLPVALASMVGKYTRELLMQRLNQYFASRIPGLKPTAGYAKDGKRFLSDLQPYFQRLGIHPDTLRRHA